MNFSRIRKAATIARRFAIRAATPTDGYNTGYEICGLIMLVGGIIGMFFMRPEKDGARLARAGALSPVAAE